MSKKEALGKGIRALLENIDSDSSSGQKEYETGSIGTIHELNLSQIEINPFQPRTEFNDKKLQELASSIKIHGVVQPITVRRLDNRHYQLIAGERRLRAASLAGLTSIPAYVRTANDQEMLEIGLIENIHREDLNAIEIAINYKRLIDECKLTQEQLADRVSKDRTTVTNYLRVLRLPPDIQKAIKERNISMGHARAIIGLEELTSQLKVFKEVISRSLSVRQTEDLVRNYSKKKPAPRQAPKLPVAYQQVQNKLATHLGTRVSMKPKNNGSGEIVISYFSDEDLNRILDLLEV